MVVAKKNPQQIAKTIGQEIKQRTISDISGRLGNFLSNSTNSLLSVVPAQFRSFLPFIASELDIQAPTVENIQDRLTGKTKQSEIESAEITQVPSIESGNRLPKKKQILGNRGQYEIEDCLGARGKGIFYQAVQLLNRQPIIIKQYELPNDQHYTFQRISGIELADGRSQDFRLIIPWEAIVDQEYCYLVFADNLYNSPTLSSYLQETGAMSSIEVYGVLNQVLQSLQFLHGQKFRLPSGLESLKTPHGNLSLDSLLISYNLQGFLIYLCDLSLWEHQIIESDLNNLDFWLQQDLKDLGKICCYLLAGNDQVNCENEQEWSMGVEPNLQKFILQLIHGKFNNAEVARHNLPNLNFLLENNYLLHNQNKLQQEPLKKPKKLIFWMIIGVFSAACVGGLIWFLTKDISQKNTANKSIDSVKKISGIPLGNFIYTSEGKPNGIWYHITEKNLLIGKKSLNNKLRELSPKLQLKSVPLINSDPVSMLKTGAANFAVSSLINIDQNPELGYQEFAYDGLVIFIASSKKGRDKSLPIALNGKISLTQLQQIYTGKITNWQELGGPQLPIKLYIPSSNEAIINFKQRVLKKPELINNFERLISRQKGNNFIQEDSLQVATSLSSTKLMRAVIQDFENENPPIGSIGFDSLSKVYGECSVYPLALFDNNNDPVSPLIQKDGKPVTPQQIDLCNDKGNYAPNITAFTSQRYPLAYPLSVIYLRDNRQEPIGEKFAEILKTTQVQCLLSETGLIPLRKLDIATCNSYQ